MIDEDQIRLKIVFLLNSLIEIIERIKQAEIYLKCNICNSYTVVIHARIILGALVT